MSTNGPAQTPLARLTVLCDNTAAVEGLTPGHGLAVLLETADRRILFDTGPDERTVANAQALGLPLGGVDAVVLSHGHYDHVGGLAAVLKRTGPVPVIAHPELFRKAYVPGKLGDFRYIGPPLRVEQYEAVGARFQWQARPCALGEHVTTTGELNSSDRTEVSGHGRFVREGEGGLSPDTFPDETSLLVRGAQGSLALTGCAHRGPEAIVRHLRHVAADHNPVALMGGFHLASHPEDQVRRLALRLHAMGVTALLPCHCTGERSSAVLRDSFLGRVECLEVGSVVEIWSDGALTAGHASVPQAGRTAEGLMERTW